MVHHLYTVEKKSFLEVLKALMEISFLDNLGSLFRVNN